MASWASEASPTLGCSIEISRDINHVYILEKWFPLRGARKKNYVRTLGFKNKIERRKRRQNNRPINLPQCNNIVHIHLS